MAAETRTREQFIAELSAVMEEVGYIQKDAQNVHQGYKYASAEAVLNKVRTALATRGMAVESRASLEHFEVYDTQKGKRSIAVVKLRLSITDGTYTATMQGIGEGVDAGDKAVMKGNTAAIKYAVASGFLISWGDDPEADPSSEKLGKAPQPAAQSEESPFDDGEFPAYQDARPIVAQMAGKKGVRELRQFFGHCATKDIIWADVVAFATEQGVDLFGDLTMVACVKLRDMIKGGA